MLRRDVVIDEVQRRPDQEPLRQSSESLAGAVLDLLLFSKGRRVGVEIKRADAPTVTPSMAAALEDLERARLLVVYPGSKRYGLGSNVEVMSLVQAVAESAGRGAIRRATVRASSAGRRVGSRDPA